MGIARFDMRNPTCEMRYATCEMRDGQGQGSEEAGWRRREGVKPSGTTDPFLVAGWDCGRKLTQDATIRKGWQARRHAANID